MAGRTWLALKIIPGYAFTPQLYSGPGVITVTWRDGDLLFIFLGLAFESARTRCFVAVAQVWWETATVVVMMLLLLWLVLWHYYCYYCSTAEVVLLWCYCGGAATWYCCGAATVVASGGAVCCGTSGIPVLSSGSCIWQRGFLFLSCREPRQEIQQLVTTFS